MFFKDRILQRIDKESFSFSSSSKINLSTYSPRRRHSPLDVPWQEHKLFLCGLSGLPPDLANWVAPSRSRWFETGCFGPSRSLKKEMTINFSLWQLKQNLLIILSSPSHFDVFLQANIFNCIFFVSPIWCARHEERQSNINNHLVGAKYLYKIL